MSVADSSNLIDSPLASRLGLDISAWLDGALGACARDVTPSAVERAGSVVDFDTFNILRSGDEG